MTLVWRTHGRFPLIAKPDFEICHQRKRGHFRGFQPQPGFSAVRLSSKSRESGAKLRVLEAWLVRESRVQTRWRRERDSNPRYPSGYSGFQDRPFQPLTHPSAGALSIV